MRGIRCCSEEYFVLLRLDEVINASGPLVTGVLDALVHESRRLKFVEVFEEANIEIFQTKRLEAREA